MIQILASCWEIGPIQYSTCLPAQTTFKWTHNLKIMLTPELQHVTFFCQNWLILGVLWCVRGSSSSFSVLIRAMDSQNHDNCVTITHNGKHETKRDKEWKWGELTMGLQARSGSVNDPYCSWQHMGTRFQQIYFFLGDKHCLIVGVTS